MVKLTVRRAEGSPVVVSPKLLRALAGLDEVRRLCFDACTRDAFEREDRAFWVSPGESRDARD